MLYFRAPCEYIFISKLRPTVSVNIYEYALFIVNVIEDNMQRIVMLTRIIPQTYMIHSYVYD